eukprot:TRINITY_DN112893_c0_g1_i1.p1 TRINITY_DN112893_c0_g1~~TRINITY_DN112893_c0_g1_i1.p1  ORF type:complete len:312 (-),score=53.83 TRINITY_DN112893_c0_g1_i1:49-984(-)
MTQLLEKGSMEQPSTTASISVMRPTMSSATGSAGSRRAASIIGSLVVCPGPPPPHQSMQSRYQRLETGLRDNWADLMTHSEVLKVTRDSASRELASLRSMVRAKEEADALKERNEQAIHHHLGNWAAQTTGKDFAEMARLHESSMLSTNKAPSQSAVEADMTSLQDNQEWPRWPGDGSAVPRAVAWDTAHRDHIKDPCSPIVYPHQAEDRWKYLFGDVNVAYAPAGTGVAAYHMTTPPTGKGHFAFSTSGSWGGLMKGQVYKISRRAKNLGPASSITLSEESDKRAHQGASISQFLASQPESLRGSQHLSR